MIDGDSAAVRYRLDTTHTPTGKRIQTEISDHITLEDGLASSFIEFVDTGLVEELTAQASNLGP